MPSKMLFTVPYTIYEPFIVVYDSYAEYCLRNKKKQHGKGGHGSVRIKALNNLVIKDEYETSDPTEVKVLLKDKVLKCNPADAVVCGILTLEEMQTMGFLHDPEDQAVLKSRLSESDKPETPPDAKPLLPPLLEFATEFKAKIFEWANDDTPEGHKVRGTDVIPISATLTKEAMVKAIVKELKKRKDPRVKGVKI
jgi:hypothetical protein